MKFVFVIFEIAVAVWNVYLSMINFNNGSLVWASFEIVMAMVLVICSMAILLK